LEALDTSITFKELTEAMCQLHIDCSGIDGLPANFYKKFLNIIGQDFYEVLLDCIGSKTLPINCH